MLVSYKYRFIFIHNYKVAGNSINKAFKKYSIPNPTKNIALNKILENSGHFGWITMQALRKVPFIFNYDEHEKAIDARKVFPSEMWNEYFKVGFVRNPWDWSVSLYHYILQKPHHWAHAKFKECGSFENYIKSGTFREAHPSQYEFFVDENENLIMDFMGKMENIDKDVEHISNKLGIKTSVPHINPSKHKNYREYYNQETKNLVGDFFKKDIELFKYDF